MEVRAHRDLDRAVHRELLRLHEHGQRHEHVPHVAHRPRGCERLIAGDIQEEVGGRDEAEIDVVGSGACARETRGMLPKQLVFIDVRASETAVAEHSDCAYSGCLQALLDGAGAQAVAQAAAVFWTDPVGHADGCGGRVAARHAGVILRELAVLVAPLQALSSTTQGVPKYRPTLLPTANSNQDLSRGSGGAEGHRCRCDGVRESPGSALTRQNCALLRVPPWELSGRKGLRRRKRRSKLLIWRFQRGFFGEKNVA